jgi:hypothetical protein
MATTNILEGTAFEIGRRGIAHLAENISSKTGLEDLLNGAITGEWPDLCEIALRNGARPSQTQFLQALCSLNKDLAAVLRPHVSLEVQKWAEIERARTQQFQSKFGSKFEPIANGVLVFQ